MDQSLRGQLLISMPHLNDAWFGHSVSVICEHSEQGAMGLIINKPLDLTLADICKELEITPITHGDAPIMFGGPVQPEHGFILHTDDGRKWKSTVVVSDELLITSSRDILEAIASGEGPAKFLICLGYAGWSEGQLESEINQNAWLNAPFNTDIIFNSAIDARLEAAARQLGIDLHLLSDQSGHA